MEKNRRLVPLPLAISGCSHEVERAAIAGEQTIVQPPLRGVPHAGSIREVAATESGDAALGDDFVAGLVDEAGSAHAVRIDRDGRRRR